MNHQSFYRCQLEWTGAAAGPAADHNTYSRGHVVSFEGRPSIQATSAVDFLGDPSRLNPEEMFVAALSSCQMLTYLAVMARMRQPVTGYRDRAEGVLEKGPDGKLWMTRATLRPCISFAAGADLEKARAMIAKAHDGCFIASSVKTEVTIEPEFVIEG